MWNVVKSGLILKIPRATQCGLLSAHILTYQQLHVILQGTSILTDFCIRSEICSLLA